MRSNSSGKAPLVRSIAPCDTWLGDEAVALKLSWRLQRIVCSRSGAMLAVEPKDRPKDAREVLSIFQHLLGQQGAILLDGLLSCLEQLSPTRPEVKPRLGVASR